MNSPTYSTCLQRLTHFVGPVKHVLLAGGLLWISGCAKYPTYEPVEVYLRTNPPLQPEVFNYDLWRTEGQNLSFFLRDSHYFQDGGAVNSASDFAIRNQELYYYIDFRNYSNFDPVHIQVDLVHYGDTVLSRNHVLQDLNQGGYDPGDTLAHKHVRFIWN